jgi:aminoglycoside phosphotransferase (APT) family kinase protein
VARPEAVVLVTDWAAALAPHGLRPLHVVGRGMEGVVVRVEGDLVVQVWHHRPVDELEALQAFYEAVALPVQTTRVLDVLRVGDRWASVEPHLPGEPLTAAATDPDVQAMADVLDALAEAPVHPALSTLPALPGEPPLAVGAGFESGLADLVEARATPVLAAAVPDLPDVLAAVPSRLRSLPPTRPALLHGDLIAANVLVDERRRPTAVLDFGFLTTVGDPAFDAAVTSSVFDMYGAGARRTETRLEQAFTRRRGHDPARLAVHRAAYAIVTATCFSASGSDGHFAWCVAMLRRPDVRDALR